MVILVSMLPASLPWASPAAHATIVDGTADTPIRDVGQLAPPFVTVQKENLKHHLRLPGGNNSRPMSTVERALDEAEIEVTAKATRRRFTLDYKRKIA